MTKKPAGLIIIHANRVAMGTTFGIPCSNLENENIKNSALYSVAETRTCNEGTRQVNRVPTSKNEPLAGGECALVLFSILLLCCGNPASQNLARIPLLRQSCFALTGSCPLPRIMVGEGKFDIGA